MSSRVQIPIGGPGFRTTILSIKRLHSNSRLLVTKSASTVDREDEFSRKKSAVLYSESIPSGCFWTKPFIVKDMSRGCQKPGAHRR